MAGLPLSQERGAGRTDWPRVSGSRHLSGRREGHRHPWQRHDEDARHRGDMNLPPAKKKSQGQESLLEAKVTTAPCVPAIRLAVEEWRSSGYKGVTETTRTLLNYWFGTEHRLQAGSTFRYHHFQREAIET